MHTIAFLNSFKNSSLHSSIPPSVGHSHRATAVTCEEGGGCEHVTVPLSVEWFPVAPGLGSWRRAAHDEPQLISGIEQITLKWWPAHHYWGSIYHYWGSVHHYWGPAHHYWGSHILYHLVDSTGISDPGTHHSSAPPHPTHLPHLTPLICPTSPHSSAPPHPTHLPRLTPLICPASPHSSAPPTW